MVLADTSIWIEFLKRNNAVYPKMKEMLESQEILGVECVFGELLQGAKNKRERESIISYWKYLPNISEKGIWIEAGLYSGIEKFSSKGIGLIDAVITTIAKKTNSKIWTSDKKLKKVLNQEEVFYPGIGG